MDDSAAITGLWQIAKADLAGDEMPAFVAEKIQLELRDGQYCVRFADDVSDRGHYTLDSTGSIKTILLSGLEGANAGRTIPAIYQLVGDRLRLCYGLDGLLPTAFTTSSEQKRYLVMYSRRERRAAAEINEK